MGWLWGTKGNPRLSRRVSDLEEDTDTLKRKLKELDLEFTTLYDKVRQALGRIAKRSAMLEAAQEPEEEESAPLTGDSSDGLTPIQRQWNQRILAARGSRGS